MHSIEQIKLDLVFEKKHLADFHRNLQLRNVCWMGADFLYCKKNQKFLFNWIVGKHHKGSNYNTFNNDSHHSPEKQQQDSKLFCS
jgi:hypothetical protein